MKKIQTITLLLYLCIFIFVGKYSFANQSDIQSEDSLKNNYENFITTNLDADNGQKGFMFDINFDNDIIIDSIGFSFWHFMTMPNANYTIDLYIIDSSYVGNETDSLSWILVSTQIINSGDISTPVNFKLYNDSFEFKQGDRKGFCLKIRNRFGSLAYTEIKNGDADTYQDENISLKGGVGSDFNQVYQKRMPNISVFYKCKE